MVNEILECNICSGLVNSDGLGVLEKDLEALNVFLHYVPHVVWGLKIGIQSQEKASKGQEKDMYFKEEQTYSRRTDFSDQYESRVEGRVFSQRGYNLSTFKYIGGTLFCDAASKTIFVYNQVSLNAQETISSKLKFEREALGLGIQIKSIVLIMEYIHQMNL